MSIYREGELLEIFGLCGNKLVDNLLCVVISLFS